MMRAIGLIHAEIGRIRIDQENCTRTIIALKKHIDGPGVTGSPFIRRHSNLIDRMDTLTDAVDELYLAVSKLQSV